MSEELQGYIFKVGCFVVGVANLYLASFLGYIITLNQDHWTLIPNSILSLSLGLLSVSVMVYAVAGDMYYAQSNYRKISTIINKLKEEDKVKQ